MSKAVPHKFPDKPSNGFRDLNPINKILADYADRLSELFTQVAGVNVDAEVGEPVMLQFSDWSEGLESLPSLTVFRLLPFRGCAILHMESALIHALMEGCYGGDIGSEFDMERTRFRSTELRLIERFSSILLDQYGSCFEAFGSLKPVFVTHESSVQYANFCKAEEYVLSQPLTLSFGESLKCQIEILLTSDAAESALEFVRSTDLDSTAEVNPLWKQSWIENIRQIRLPLRTIVAQPSLHLSELFNMKPGDIIPITLRAKPPLFVGDRKFAIGTVGEKNGTAAFKIDQIERKELQ